LARKPKVTREALQGALIGALDPLRGVRAAWEQGAASFGRVDEYSDIDLIVIVEDDGVEEVFRAVEDTLDYRFGIADKYRIPEPAWHGHSQCFYWVKGASPYLFVDMAVEKASSKNRFLEYSIHGPPVVRIDKGVVSDDSPGAEEFARKLEDRLEALKTTFRLFQVEVLKELERGNGIEALAFYNAMTLRPLVEVLRIKYCPWRHNFNTRYVYYDLPSKVVKDLEKLYFIRNAKELAERRAEADKWFWEIADSIELKDVRKLLAKAARRRG